MKSPVVLRIYRESQLLMVKQFAEPQIVIGRQDTCQVVLNDPDVSLIHAAIEERDSGYYLCDLGSEKGTFRSGEAILDCKLENGDLIAIGPFRMEFFVGVPKPKAAPTTKPTVAPVAAASTPSAAPPNVVPAAAPTSVAKPTPAPAPFSSGGGMDTVRPASFNISRRPKPTNFSKHQTFAPESKYKSVHDFVKPSKGTVVEVLVAWKERVINVYHFSNPQTLTVGSHPECDVQLPLGFSRVRKMPFLRISGRAIVMLTSEINGELVRGQQSSNFSDLLRQNRLIREGAGYALALEQGELVKINFSDNVSLIIRYTSDTPKPIAAPLFDLTATETTAVILAMLLAFLIVLFTTLHTEPDPLTDEDLNEEAVRPALMIQRPPSQKLPEPPPEEVKEEVKPPPKPQEKPRLAEQQRQSQVIPKAQSPAQSGKAPSVLPREKKDNSKSMVSVKQGGSIKTGPTAGAQATTNKKDPTKSGIFGVFGSGGRQSKTSQGSSGPGELAGLANVASGKAGQNEDRAGDGIGTPFRETGQGGTGTSTFGRPDVKSGGGRGSGNSGYGMGGLGSRQGVKIVPGGMEEAFSGTVDREAIRRVIQQNLRSIRYCYEKELNRNKDLFGKLVIEWDVGEHGRVLKARATSNELNNSVSECLVDRLKSWRFPEPPVNETYTVTYPFLFSN